MPQCVGEPVQQVVAIRHRRRIPADGECTAGGVIGGDAEEVAARGYLALLPSGECFSDLLRRRGAYLAYAGEVFCLKSRDVGADHADGFLRIAWISPSVGIEVGHSWRAATIAAATTAT